MGRRDGVEYIEMDRFGEMIEDTKRAIADSLDLNDALGEKLLNVFEGYMKL